MANGEFAIMMNIAHRGFSSRYPENTLLAFHKALELGVTNVELDLQLTFDGHLIVMHDLTVDRTTNGSGTVSDLTLNEIRELDAGSWKDPDYAGLKVPTYEEILNGLAPSTTIVTELKFVGNNGIQKVVDLIQSHDAYDRVAISSFDLPKLPIIKQMAPELPTTALVKRDNAGIEEWVESTRQLGIDTLAPQASETTKEVVEAAHRKGLLCRAWGLGHDQGDEMNRLIDLGVDGMTTDYPDVLQALLVERGLA